MIKLSTLCPFYSHSFALKQKMLSLPTLKGTITEAWCGKYPYRRYEAPLMQQIEIVDGDPPLPNAPAAGIELVSFLDACLQKEPSKRLSSAALLESFWEVLKAGSMGELAEWVSDGAIDCAILEDCDDENGDEDDDDDDGDLQIGQKKVIPNSSPLTSTASTSIVTKSSMATSTTTLSTNNYSANGDEEPLSQKIITPSSSTSTSSNTPATSPTAKSKQQRTVADKGCS
eukprot:m.150859 g.150859  ORF g.150859 m.150859 type:complete len:229 (-) comp13288_c0_seq1:1389-2075(-)